MKLRIVCDGQRTLVLDELGNRIEGVQLVSFQAAGDQAAEAFLHLQPIQVEIVADAVVSAPLPASPYVSYDEPVQPQDLQDLLGPELTEILRKNEHSSN